MKKSVFPILLGIILATSGGFHYWEYRQIKKVKAVLQLQSEIEAKRTALMVLYQEVLQGVAKELNQLRRNKVDSESKELSNILKELPQNIHLEEVK